MNNITWKRVKKLRDSNSIAEFEKEYGIIIPDNFKEIIINSNSGRPSLDIVRTLDGREIEVKALLSFNKDDVENIYNVIDYFKEQFNGRILPIATEPSGDYFCIDITSNSIFYWQSEGEKLTFIANNLEEFLDSLYEL